MTKPVWVITWRYDDGSSSGVVAAREKEEHARAIIKLLCSTDSSKLFDLHVVDMEPT